MELQGPILRHLYNCNEPCTVVELAHALGMLEPGDVVPDRLRSTLTGMVRHQQVKRVHHGDGVLRYSPLTPLAGPKASAPTAMQQPAVGTFAPGTVVAPKTAPNVARAAHRYETGVSARVLAALVPGAPPVRRTVIESRISPPLTTTQVVMALQALRKKGDVVRSGTTSNAGWQRVDQGAPTPAVAPASPAAAASINLPLSTNLGAVRTALQQAKLAVDAALQALEA